MVTARNTGKKAGGAGRKAGKQAKASGKSAGKETGRTAARTTKGKASAGAKDGSSRSNPLGLEVDDDVLEFIDALNRFKKQHNRPFPSWSEVLHVLRQLGYRRG